MMINQFLIVGKVLFKDHIINTLLTIDNGEHTIPVLVGNNVMYELGIDGIDPGDMVAVKGKLEYSNGVKLYVDKISLILKGNEK